MMSALRDFVAGPWRAVLVLGVTQILAWGAIFGLAASRMFRRDTKRV